jgi:RimJ/RimL family protein N-acetyltransferase
MRRLGMRFEREAVIEDEGAVFDAVIYAITANEWRTRRAAGRR